MNTTRLMPGDVVQINPAVHERNSFFAGSFMTVVECSEYGAMGYILMAEKERGEMPGLAFFRCSWADMEYVGRAIWVFNWEPKTSPESRGESAG